VLAFGAAARAATPDSVLLAPVQRMVDAINHAEATPPKGVFTTDATVIDDFAPYRWSGKTNAIDWYKGLLGTDAASRADFLALKGVLSVGAPQFSRVTGDTAYFVLPGLFIFNESPTKRTRQTSTWVIAEKLVKGKWLIAAHAWAITGETTVK
jgi:hypothetical protein